MNSPAAIRKGWVDVPHGQVHFRYGGSGPPVVLLHDSPRSSQLHTATIAALADEFTLIALDTPGYGLSTPLPVAQPEIPDFARALGTTLRVLGLRRCPIYAFHTSSKIALELAATEPDRATVVVMDGLSMPESGPNLEFIRRYMQPFEPSTDGSHVAAAWTRVRDFHRFFPWFAHTAQNRLPIELPDEAHLHTYATDLFMAGRHYVDAYAAAMRYLPLPVIPRIATRAIFMCRADDVLFAHLDRLPSDLPELALVERLGSDRTAWLERLRAIFREHASADAFTPPEPLEMPADGRARQGYVDIGTGQLRVRRQGIGGRRALLMLHDVPGSSAQLRGLMAELSADRVVAAPDMPGVGESSAVAELDLESGVDALLETLDHLDFDSIDIYAEFLAGPFAARLAARAPARVSRLILDGVALPGSAQRRELWKRYCPKITPRADGTHLLALWHRLRDQELVWPWYSRDVAAIRRIDPQIDAARLNDMLVDVMKQLDTYGAAALAAIDCSVRELLRAVRQPVLLTNREDDPRYRGVAQAARLLEHAQIVSWPAGNAARARVMLDFLDT